LEPCRNFIDLLFQSLFRDAFIALQNALRLDASRLEFAAAVF
jgi:hypothetical protein